ncbi:MAG: HD domain-containing protein [Spirochaetia bacterium]|nr:HD domain-containing protein [Spirochaetia bacterium]
MKKVLVNELKAGMAFNMPVYIDKDNILVNAKEPLKQSDIDRLIHWNIKEVETMGIAIDISDELFVRKLDLKEKKEIDEAKNDLRLAIQKKWSFNELFEKGLKLLREAYISIPEEKPFQISLIRDLSDEIVDFVNKTPLSFIHLFYRPVEDEITVEKHAISSAIFAVSLAQTLEFSKPKMVELIFSILLLDIGMSKVPSEILSKDSAFTEEDRRKLQAHTVYGYQLLTQVVKLKNTMAIVALQHHEHYDGSGYPKKLKGDMITEYSRIAAITDSLAAMLEKKNYQESILPYNAMKELLTLGLYRYDPVFMKLLLEKMAIYPIGSLVSLSNGAVGIVAGAVRKKPMRPIVMLLKTASGKSLEKPEFIHLLYHSDKYITKAESPHQLGILVEEELERLLIKL